MTPDTIDTHLFLQINHFAQRTEWLHGVMYAVANYGIAVFVILLIAAWLYARREDIAKLTAFVWATIGTLVALALNQPLVHYFHEARPYTALQNILVLAHRTNDYAFPSDHSTMAGAVTVGLFLVNPILGVVSLIFAFVLIFSRVYIAAHYPYDVLVGFAFGAIIMLVGYILIRKPLSIIIGKLANTPLRPLVTNKAASREG